MGATPEIAHLKWCTLAREKVSFQAMNARILRRTKVSSRMRSFLCGFWKTAHPFYKWKKSKRVNIKASQQKSVSCISDDH